MMSYLPLIITIVVVLLIAKFILKASAKTIIGLVVNAVVGLIVLWLVNYLGLITIPVNIVTCLITGAFGVPGLLLLIVLVLLHVI